MGGWLNLAILLLKLLSDISTRASESRLKGEGTIDALARVLTEASKLVQAANVARAGVDAAARAGGLHDDDGERRD